MHQYIALTINIRVRFFVILCSTKFPEKSFCGYIVRNFSSALRVLFSVQNDERVVWIIATIFFFVQNRLLSSVIFLSTKNRSTGHCAANRNVEFGNLFFSCFRFFRFFPSRNAAIDVTFSQSD